MRGFNHQIIQQLKSYISLVWHSRSCNLSSHISCLQGVSIDRE